MQGLLKTNSCNVVDGALESGFDNFRQYLPLEHRQAVESDNNQLTLEQHLCSEEFALLLSSIFANIDITFPRDQALSPEL